MPSVQRLRSASYAPLRHVAAHAQGVVVVDQLRLLGPGARELVPERGFEQELVDDLRRPLAVATRALGLVAALLLAGWDALESETRAVVAAGAQAEGHIVNLGHGVPAQTDPEVLTRLVELVHSL